MAALEFEGFIEEPNRQTGAVVIGALIIVVIATVIFYVISSTSSSAFSTEQRKVEQLQNQITALGEITKQGNTFTQGKESYISAIANSVNWQAFWDEIVTTQIRGVSYRALSLDESGIVRVDAFAPSMVFLAKQLKSIDSSPVFSQASLLATANEGDKIKFSLSFLLDKNKLKAQAQ